MDAPLDEEKAFRQHDNPCDSNVVNLTTVVFSHVVSCVILYLCYFACSCCDIPAHFVCFLVMHSRVF